MWWISELHDNGHRPMNRASCHDPTSDPTTTNPSEALRSSSRSPQNAGGLGCVQMVRGLHVLPQVKSSKGSLNNTLSEVEVRASEGVKVVKGGVEDARGWYRTWDPSTPLSIMHTQGYAFATDLKMLDHRAVTQECALGSDTVDVDVNVKEVEYGEEGKHIDGVRGRDPVGRKFIFGRALINNTWVALLDHEYGNAIDDIPGCLYSLPVNATSTSLPT
ncbi:hypothetical protein EI94DRAFT_1706328 [Lactarius quietus]|nr:hypothetical protein EI94DRAFT_1706328 [Lactarius quietus]